MALNITETETRRKVNKLASRPEQSPKSTTSQHALKSPRSRPSPRPLAVPADRRQQALQAGTQPRRSSSAGEAVLAYLKIHLGTLTSLEPLVRADEPDSVHQMRVATRRLRAALRSFGTVIPRSRS